MWEISRGVLELGGQPVNQIKSPNSSGKFSSTPNIVVIHFTAGSSARSSAEWFRNAANKNSSAHVVVERDGNLFQCVNFERVAWHAGKSRWRGLTGLNRHSIGIELANWGYLRSANGHWVTSTGKAIAEPFMAPHRNGNPDGSTHAIGWEPYPDEQIDAAQRLVKTLIDAYKIDEIVGHDDIAPTRKWDPGPAFNMARFRTSLLERRRDNGDNIAIVVAASGLNLRNGPGIGFSVVETLKDQTKLQLLGADGNWLQVSTFDSKGNPDKTGYVHRLYVRV